MARFKDNIRKATTSSHSSQKSSPPAGAIPSRRVSLGTPSAGSLRTPKPLTKAQLPRQDTPSATLPVAQLRLGEGTRSSSRHADRVNQFTTPESGLRRGLDSPIDLTGSTRLDFGGSEQHTSQLSEQQSPAASDLDNRPAIDNYTGASSTLRTHRRNFPQADLDAKLYDGNRLHPDLKFLRRELEFVQDKESKRPDVDTTSRGPPCSFTQGVRGETRLACAFVNSISVTGIHNARQAYADLSQTGKGAAIRDILERSIHEHEGSGKRTLKLYNLGANLGEVCTNCFRTIYLLPPSTLFRRKRAALAGELDYEEKGCARGGNRNKGVMERIMTWIEIWLNAHGEPHPRREELMVDKCDIISLRAECDVWWAEQDWVHGPLRPEEPAQAESVTGVASRKKARKRFFADSTFYQVWRIRIRKGNHHCSVFPVVRFTKHKAVSSKCFACSRLQKLMQLALGSSVCAELRARVLKQKALHRRFFVNERVIHNLRVCEAMNNYAQIGSIVMDGMDSAKTCLPSYADLQGELVGLYKNFLKVKLTGVMLHGYNLNVFATFPWIRCGANLCASTLMHTLVKWQEGLRMQGRELPRTLYLLVDGGSENVNKTLFALYAWLVTFDIFEQIYVTRLPVGHTHNDLDQRWSIVAQRLHGKHGVDARTLEALLQVVRDAFSGNYNTLRRRADSAEGQEERNEFVVQGGAPIVESMHCAHDWTKHFESVVNEKIEGHASSRRLEKDTVTGAYVTSTERSAEVMHMLFAVPGNIPGGLAMMRYKTASQYSMWHPNKDEPAWRFEDRGGASTPGWIPVFGEEVETIDDLPLPSKEPPMAEFIFHEPKVKREDVVKNKPSQPKLDRVAKCILNIKTATNEMYMNPEEHASWVKQVAEFPNHPSDVQNLPAHRRPLYHLRAPLATPVPRPPASDPTAAGSAFDAPENPPAMSLVYDKDTKKAKVQRVKDLAAAAGKCFML